jgi:hypothetical protein
MSDQELTKMTPSDYEKFEQQIFDQMEELELEDKQSEEEKRITKAAEQVIHAAEDKGWHLKSELEAKVSTFKDLMNIIYKEYPWRPSNRPKITEQELMHYFNKLQS